MKETVRGASPRAAREEPGRLFPLSDGFSVRGCVPGMRPSFPFGRTGWPFPGSSVELAQHLFELNLFVGQMI